MKPTKPELPNFIIRKYTPTTHKSSSHISIEWPIPTWIKIYEELIVAAHRTNPADLELRQRAKEIKEEIINVIPKTY
jgi:hypothetical protein